jgi:hypothetical protein
MIQFDVAPPVPSDYHRLGVLTPEEIENARSAAYVADGIDPLSPVCREGLNNYDDPYLGDNIFDWRVRMFIIWFCYLYENFSLIHNQLGAIEEILLEFKVPGIVDLPGRILSTMYAGSFYGDLPDDGVAFQLGLLKPHYEKGIELLEQFRHEQLLTR